MRSGGTSRWIFGLLLVTVGVLLLLDTTDAIETDNVWRLIWPAVLVFVGAWLLFRERGRSLLGLVVLLLGAGFFAQNVGWIESGWIARYWPVVVIGAGLAILADATGVLRRRRMEGDVEVRGEDWLRATAVMSGRRERVTSIDWRGGDVTAIMGGVQLDLREAKLAAEGAQLDVTAVMGGVEIWVPSGWRISPRITPLLGGVEDKTTPGPTDGDAPRLEITGTALMGGVEIKHKPEA
jgi:predicted membrane protein